MIKKNTCGLQVAADDDDGDGCATCKNEIRFYANYILWNLIAAFAGILWKWSISCRYILNLV